MTGLLVRLAALAIDGGYVPAQDAADYHRHAVSVAAGEGLAPSDYVPGGGPSALRAPGYPHLLGALYAAAGESVAAGRLLNAALGALTVLLVVLLTRSIWGRAAALAAGALTAVYPPLVGMGLELFSENLFVPLLLAAAIAVLRARESGDLRWAAAAGLLAGCVALTRGPGLVVLVPIAYGLWVVRPRLSARALAAPAVGVACALLVLSPWIVRNLAEFGRVVPVTTATGYGLAGTYNEVSRADGARWRSPLEVPGLAPLFARADLDEGELDAALRSAAGTFVADHPLYVGEVLARNLPRLLYVGDSVVSRGEIVTDPGIGNRGNTPETIAFALVAILALTGGAAMVVSARRRRRAGTIAGMLPSGPLFLWLIPLALVLTAALVAGLPRYRVVADPFLLIAAGVGLVGLVRRARGTRAAVAIGAGLLLAGCGSGDRDDPAAAPTADPRAVAAWVDRAEPVCERAARAAERLVTRFRDAEASDLLEQIDEALVAPAIRVRARQARELRELGPPPEGAEELRTFVGLFDPISELVRLRLAASRAGDRPEADRFEDLAISLAGEQLRAARAAGMRACATDVTTAAFG